jgi:Ca2+-binding EF-hand superfamily protein
MKKKQLSGSIEPLRHESPGREEKKLTKSKLTKDLSPDSRQFDSKLQSPAKKKAEVAASKQEEGPKGPPEIYLHRNPQGGIYVHEKDIETLFRFIDSNNYGRITMQDLKKKVSLFAKEMTNRDFKFLMAGKNDIELKELYDILKYNELEDFDPIAEAFKFYDPEGTGYVDEKRLREIFSMLGYEDLTSGDYNILLECASSSLEKDRISLDDFRKLIPIYEPPEGDAKMKNINVISDPEVHNQFVANLKEYGDTKKF